MSPTDASKFDAKPSLAKLAAGQTLTQGEAEELFEGLLHGSLEEAQIGALLGMLQARWPSVDELTGAARVMRRHVTQVPSDGVKGVLIDTCGTGGAPKAFNVSTLAAIVAAAAAPGKIAVAKHGNRSRTGRGSAEILSSLGVQVDAGPAVQGECLRQVGVCFCYAIHHHPAMRYVSAARRALGFPTIFNLLGPLTNPAGAAHQLIGIYSAAAGELMIRTLANLGTKRALVVRGLDGLDEITLTGPTQMWELRDGKTFEWTLNPSELGLDTVPLESLQAHDLSAATDIAMQVLANVPGPRTQMVQLNAAAALYVGGAASSIEEGLRIAQVAMETGAARRTLEALIGASHAGPIDRP